MATKELQAIVAACGEARSRGQAAALVMVVRTSGSTYRRPGARMLVLQGGEREVVGSISGGCLEDDARDRALEAIVSRKAALIRYDTTAEGDIVFGSGLGCQGTVEVLIQPLPLKAPGRNGTSGAPGVIECLARTVEARQRAALATVFSVVPANAADGDDRLLGRFLCAWDSTGNQLSTDLTDPELAGRIEKDARATLGSKRPAVRTYRSAAGQQVKVYIDFIPPPRSLLVCGAGHDAGSVVRLAKELGWRVRVADPRRAYATRERFPCADEVIVCPASDFAARVPVEDGEAAVVMTHRFLHDLAILRALLVSKAGYIGVLGPSRRTGRLLAELNAAGDLPAEALTPKSLRRLHGPAGLDIGADAPEQIALSIIAEIEAVAARRPGGPLKRRRGPLHGTSGAGATEAGSPRRTSRGSRRVG